ncbi:DUF4347 domain-containing protein [Limnoraphis robusta Tam1]|uniref:DUF4347 domain-containing protein n=1 Tax=Limnoraphis robusta TaxID=1118279 RepID=UPI002B21A9AA|nr:DUF4347 domain-containing protein [Limnoraphis robusta]MEA5538203.1 DUF4347 domain-containing protein [Limnoraphis robusta Tam1]
MVSFTPSKNLICIDAKVEGYEHLCQGVLLGSEVIILDANQDGVEQITELLRDRIRRSTAPRIQTLHIVSHGSPGCLYLGNTQLSINTLDRYADQLQQWRGALTSDAEILLYGCDVAQQETQKPHPYFNLTDQSAFTHSLISPFIQKIQHLTGAKIAASSTKIGSEKLGGNWQLDIQTDQILSPLAFTESVRESYAGVFATFTVINANDAGAGSLREAIDLANANPDADIIQFDQTVFNTPQTIQLASQLNNNNNNQTVQLNIDDNNGNNLTLNGPGANNLIIQGIGNGSVFRVNTRQPETVVRISGLTIQNSGTGIQYGSGQGKLEIDSSTIANNNIGIVSRSQLELTNSTVQNNVTRGISLSGSNSLIQGNTFITTDPAQQQRNGIYVFTQNNSTEPTSNVQIIENFIGTDADGTPGLGHRDQGIEIARAIGTQVIRNVVSGNGIEGILVSEGSNDTVIRENSIGVAPDGTTPLPNNSDGIKIRNTTGTVIGGVTPEDRNIISGNNGNGILLETQVDAPTPTSNTQILGNYIGVDQTGNLAVPNTEQGIQIDASTLNTIGGVNPGEGNIISGNGADGVLIVNAANDNTILGNLIGVNAAGDAPVPNTNNGIRIDGSTNNDIGLDRVENPDVPGTNRNVISGNGINGVLIANSSNETKVLGNLIGTNGAGNVAIPNGEQTDDPAVINGGIGVEIRNSSNNIIGRKTPGEQNTISGNLVDGIRITGTPEVDSTGNIIQSNLIGLDATGVAAIPNQTNGILISSATANIIGGSETGQGNTISGNTINGLVLNTANSNQIIGNFIGTNSAGNAAVANSNNGLELDNAVGNSVIGNLISGNSVNGVSIVNASSGNPIQGNRIGVAADGTTGLANANSGILVNNATNNIIGGLEAAQGNTIAFNTGDGVTIINDASVGNAISGNSIYSNGAAEDNTAIGIDLANDGVTVNDALDADLGPNALQNYPELVLAEPVENNTVVAGRFNSLPNTTYRLEFFSNVAVDSSENGQGQSFIGTTEVTTDAEGNAIFTATLPATGDLSGQFITATATDPTNNTSEFSNAVDVSLPEISITENLAQNEGNDGTVDYTYTVSLSQPSTQNIVVNYTTNDSTATVADNDYVDNDGSLRFEANPFLETPPSLPITVQVNGDITFEGDEVFNVSLDSANYGNIVTPSVTGTITNDDAPPSISISNITLNEGDDQATVTVTASKISGFAASFNYATSNSTAAAGLDYTATNGNLTIPIGQTTVSFNVPLIDDSLEEPDKTFNINLTNPVGIDVESSILTATVNILDDDLSPVLSLDGDNINFTEGGDAIAIANNITITDADSTTLSTASISLKNPLNPESETLSIVGSLPGNITASEYNLLSGQLTLTGVASLADYQTAFSQIVYNNTSATPNTNPREIEITVSDGINASNAAFSTVNLTAVNTPPVPNNDTIITRIDTPITFNITNNDFDPDGIIDPSSVELDLTGLNNQGNATVDEQGNLTFTPATGFTGSVNIPYTVLDNGGESATAQISITVNTSTNQPPVTQNLITEIIANTATQVAIPALTATDFDGTITAFQITRLPENGQLQLNGETVTANQTISLEDAGNLTFIPKLGFVGLAEFQYTTVDNDNASDLTPAIVVIPVNSTNQLPVAADNIASPNPGNNTAVLIPELTATDADGSITGFRITKFPTNSTLLLNGQPLTTPEIAVADAANLSYVGGGNFTGDSFQYTAIDAQNTEDPTPATVTLPALTTDNLLPVTVDKIGPIIPNAPTPVTLPSLQGTDADGSIASFTITELPVGGQLLLGGTAVAINQVIPADQADQLAFTPNPEFSGLTQFSYVATDNQGGTDETPAIYNLLVNVTNIPPLPSNQGTPLLKNVSTQVPLPPLASINNENAASFTLVELPLGGQVFLNGEPVTLNQVIPVDQAGQLTFTSNLDFSGSTVLKFTATDTAGITSSQVGEVSLFILPNLLPTVEPLELPGIVPTSVPVGLPSLVGTDEDGTIASFTLNNIPAPAEGQLLIGETPVFNLAQVSEITPAEAANLRFEANTNFVGDIVLNYVATDNDGQSSQPASISFSVLVGTPSIDFDIPQSEPIADELIVPEIPNNGTAIPIPPLTANDLNGEIVSFSILELPLEAQGQLFFNGVVVTRLSQVTEITIAQASQLTFVPTATFSGQIQLRYTATNNFGLTSSSSRIILQVPTISSEILTLPTDLPLEILAFTATLAGFSQSYSFISESIALNTVEFSIEGTEINDILIGVEVSEQIVGLGGDDEITAFGGNDNIFGNLGNDIIDAGDGNDVVDGGTGENFIVGGVGNDTLIGGSDNDTLVGGSDDAELADTDGQDLLDGGDGNDTLFGNEGEDTLIGGDGNDLIFSGKDNDLASGEDGNDTIFGDVGDDSIVGGEGNDLLLGNQGNDTISGGEGNDFIAGGQGDDLLFGDQGNDQVYGDLGADTVYGNQGNDSLYGGEGNDSLIGGEGDDFLSGDGGDDILSGGEGADIFALLLNSGSDVIVDFADSQDLLGLTAGLSFEELTIEQSETATLIRFEGQLLVTLNRINSTLITSDDFITI